MARREAINERETNATHLLGNVKGNYFAEDFKLYGRIILEWILWQ